MKLLLSALIVMTPMAHAGWWSRFCERYIISNVAPEQFEEEPDSWLQSEIDRIKIRQAWGKASAEDILRLRYMEAELAHRLVFRKLGVGSDE